MMSAERIAAPFSPGGYDFGANKRAAKVGIYLAALIFAMPLSTAAAADVPALCSPAKARYDKAVSSGDRATVLGARDRIKALAGACPQLWAAVRNAPLPAIKEPARSPQLTPKADTKQSGQSAQAKPRSPNPRIDKETQRLLKMGYTLYETPTISQPLTTYVGEGDTVKPNERWHLWRTQEGCYFFIRLPIETQAAQDTASQKKLWSTRVGQYRWKGQCTPGKLINGVGILEEQFRSGSGTEVKTGIVDWNNGTMINGLWNGTVHRTRRNVPEWPGLYDEYRMGCNVTRAFDANCQSPRVPSELAGNGG